MRAEVLLAFCLCLILAAVNGLGPLDRFFGGLGGLPADMSEAGPQLMKMLQELADKGECNPLMESLNIECPGPHSATKEMPKLSQKESSKTGKDDKLDKAKADTKENNLDVHESEKDPKQEKKLTKQELMEEAEQEMYDEMFKNEGAIWGLPGGGMFMPPNGPGGRH